MSHSIGTEDEKEGLPETDLRLLEVLIKKVIEKLKENSYEPKVQDALKAIRLKQKFSKTSQAEKIFWQAIEEIRRSELERKEYSRVSRGLAGNRVEAQILKTIIGLKNQVKNGALPVKTITDAFNKGKSKQNQLTYQRVGRILSTMGFQKAKAGNNSAILWNQEKIERMLEIPPFDPSINSGC